MGHYGGHIKCLIHNSNINVSETKKDVHEFMTIGCPYCQFEEIDKLRKELKEVTDQRNSLLEAIDVAKTIKIKG